MHIDLPTFGHLVRKRRHRHPSPPHSKPDKIRRALSAPTSVPRHLTMQVTDRFTEEPLSVFNQCSPRVYICVVLCFPCDDSRRKDAVDHIRQSLTRLADERPLFAARLRVASNGRVVLRRSRVFEIEFDEVPYEKVVPYEDGKAVDYETLKRREFPPGTFIHPRYGKAGLGEPNGDLLPLSKVEVAFAPGGLLLSIFLQHSITDGGSLRVFLEAFGNQTRNITDSLPSEQKLPVSAPRLHGVESGKISESSAFKGLVKSCPEYTILPDLSGPTQPPPQTMGNPISSFDKVGKVFVFTDEKLKELRALIQDENKSDKRPTAYISLASLAFAHITEARIKHEPGLTGIEASNKAMLWNSVNWRPRAFPKSATKNYFGNAVLPAVTRVTREHAKAASHHDSDLARLAVSVKKSIDVVDEDYVRQRMSMMSQAPDPRMVGVNYDPRSPEVLAFNTWRHFGADIEWNIPGVPVSKPDTIRRATGGWGLGTALLLPAKEDSKRQELFVSLSVDAMQALCEDKRWMKWVDRVIG
ncbi:hypothetical protein GGR51DRAFT_493050 [Nemania sp. FL0031]|nr:hypothetical protein GGR51DRAFT_493050 [Nemania sp. FL0031]